MARETEQRLGRNVFESLAIHLAVWGTLLVLLAPPTIPWVRAQFEKRVIALGQNKKTTAPARVAAGASLSPREAVVARRAESRINQALAADVSQKDKELLGLKDEDLAKAIRNVVKASPPGTDTSTLTKELEKQGFTDMADKLKASAKQELQKEIRSQLKVGIDDQIKNQIEHGVAAQMGQNLADKVRDRLNEERQQRRDKVVANLEELKKQFAEERDSLDKTINHVRNDPPNSPSDAEKQTSEAAARADQAARDALANVAKTFPAAAAQGDTAARILAAETSTNLRDAAQSISNRNKDAALAQLGKAHDSLDQRTGAVSQMEDQVRQAANSNDDVVSRKLLGESMGEVKDVVASTWQKQSLDSLAGKVTDRLSQAFSERAAKLDVSPDQLRAMIAEETRKNLAAERLGRPPELGAALSRTREDNHLVTLGDVDRTNAAVQAAITAFTATRQAEAALSLTDNSKSVVDLIQQQARIADQYQSARHQVETTRHLARATSAANQDRIFSIGQSESRAGIDAKLNQIPELLTSNDRGSADSLRGQVLQGLDERVRQLQDLQNALNQDHNNLASTAKKPVEAVEPEPAAAAKFRSEIKDDAGKIASDQMPGIVASAGDVELSDLPPVDSKTEVLEAVLGKIDQLQGNLADGRPGVGIADDELDGDELAASDMNLYGSRFGAMNAEAMQKYGKDLRDRTNPDKFYDPVGETAGMATTADPIGSRNLPAIVYRDPTSANQGGPTSSAIDPNRQVPVPKFKTLSFGAAAMMEKPVVIDGDLSDWGALQHPMPTQFRSDGVRVTDPTQVYVRWTPEGLYFGYTVKKQGPIFPAAHDGDCMEVWMDGQNVRRKWMIDSPTSQQFFLAPFGFQNDPAPAVVEVRRGARGMNNHSVLIDRTGSLGKVAARMGAGSYTVEAFLSRKALAYPNLVPGAYLAFNFSINRGPAPTDWEQWSSPKSDTTWDRPDTWGDLLLLGSDGKSRFVSFTDPTQAAAQVVPGQPLAFEVQDKDMDLNPSKKDRVPAVLRVQGEQEGLFVVLEETTPDSGVFRGSVNTQPEGAPPKPNTLNLRGGETVELIYNDMRAEYGESNRLVKATLSVATPVLRLAAKP